MSTICYDRSGNEAPGLVACSSSSGSNGTACCLPGDNCATNGLCVDPDFADMQTPYFVRGCSDVKWESAACVDNCNAFEGNGVKTCGSSKFCCYDFDGCDCDNSTAVFSLSPVRVATTIPSATGLSTRSSHAAAASTTAASLQTANTNNDDNIKVGLSVGLGVGIPLQTYPLLSRRVDLKTFVHCHHSHVRHCYNYVSCWYNFDGRIYLANSRHQR
ncbi:hypothetical protein EDB81DRAFT_878692 [Dactylonectria macrodidyma]|uniref:Uncharacterized protein n=1 Tax=Dactylonectria macrodidyma TaxID=307937 RepID=A0A9P9FNR4_9HYPO|nr:hypothetical protein EDB81DRAFT_878692 [Dactylonectria macrodidyma]